MHSQMLRSEQDRATRIELLRALGVLGAPDPTAVMQLQLAKQRSDAAASSAGDGGGGDGRGGAVGGGVDAGGGVGPSHADFYPSVAIRALTRILP